MVRFCHAVRPARTEVKLDPRGRYSASPLQQIRILAASRMLVRQSIIILELALHHRDDQSDHTIDPPFRSCKQNAYINARRAENASCSKAQPEYDSKTQLAASLCYSARLIL
jgi:hypothetical protein